MDKVDTKVQVKYKTEVSVCKGFRKGSTRRSRAVAQIGYQIKMLNYLNKLNLQVLYFQHFLKVNIDKINKIFINSGLSNSPSTSDLIFRQER
jgi:hypothetical protein